MKIIKWLVLVAVVGGAIFAVVYNYTKPAEGEQARSSQTAEPSSSPVPSETAPATPEATSEAYTFEEQPILEDKPDEKQISDDPRPSDELVWKFETAYHLANAEERNAAFALLATPQYQAANHTTDKDRSDGAVVAIVRDASTVEISVNSDMTAARVVTNATLRISRDGEVLNEIPDQRHETFWVNTPEGWKVAQEQ